MSELAHLSVVFVILGLLTGLSIIGTFTTSPVLAIFALVFLLASAAVLWELRSCR